MEINTEILKQIVLFILFVGFSVGSVALITATFYVAPMAIYLPYAAEPVTISGLDLGAILAIGALISLFILIETIK